MMCRSLDLERIENFTEEANQICMIYRAGVLDLETSRAASQGIPSKNVIRAHYCSSSCAPHARAKPNAQAQINREWIEP